MLVFIGYAIAFVAVIFTLSVGGIAIITMGVIAGIFLCFALICYCIIEACKAAFKKKEPLE
jgi:hypothetical protein